MNIISARLLDTTESCIEITYTKNFSGKKAVDFVYTSPNGSWTELVFGEDSQVLYTNFLNTMVFKNLEVHRKLARFSLESILYSSPMSDYEMFHTKIKLLNAICILDPTFVPPRLNIRCLWQRNCLNSILTWSFNIISNCRNEKRLERYFIVLQGVLTQQ